MQKKAFKSSEKTDIWTDNTLDDSGVKYVIVS